MLRIYLAHWQKTLVIALPIILGNVGHMVLSLADSAMVGRIGSNQLAAASLANGVATVLLVLGIGLTLGSTPLVAASLGSNNRSSIEDWLRNSTLINAVAGLLLFGLVWLLSPALALLNQPEEVVVLATPYFKVVGMSLIPLMLFQTYKQFAEGLSYTTAAMIISVFSNVLNIFLNWVFIFGHFGMPRMELMGAGWATLFSRVIMALLMMGYVYYNKHFKAYRAGFVLKGFSWSQCKKLLAVGLPIGFQFVLEVGVFVFGLIMIGWIGATPLAAHQIAISMAAVTYMIASGVASATTVRVGYYFGANKVRHLLRSAISSYVLVMMVMALGAIGFIIFRYDLPLFFTFEKEVQQIAASLLLFAAVFQISDGLQVTGLGILRGMQDVKMPTVIALVSYWIIGLPVGYFFAFVAGWGAEGVWMGFVVGLTTAAVLIYYRFRNRYRFFSKQKQKSVISSGELETDPITLKI